MMGKHKRDYGRENNQNTIYAYMKLSNKKHNS